MMKDKRIVGFILLFLLAGTIVGFAAVPQNTFRQNAGGTMPTFNATQGYFIGPQNVTSTLRYPQNTASYTVWEDGGIYFAKNSTTGEITTNANAATLGQTLVDSLTNGGRVYFTKDVYSVTSRIRNTNDDVDLIGEKGVVFDGGGVNPGNNIISLEADNCRLSNIKFFNYTGTAAIVQIVGINVQVDKSVFETVPEGIRVDNSEYINIINNEITDVTNGYGVRLVGTKDSSVENNYIHDYDIVSGRGISVQQNAANPSQRIRVANNRIINVKDDSGIAIDAHLFASNFVSNITVENNYLIGCGDIGIFVEGDLVAERRNSYITVRNNYVAESDSDGIRVTLSNFFIVTENFCVSNGQDVGEANRNGITIWNSRYGTISTNYCIDNQTAPTQEIGIFEHSANSLNNVIKDNYLLGNSVDQIDASAPAASNVTINQNIGYVGFSDIRLIANKISMWNGTEWRLIENEPSTFDQTLNTTSSVVFQEINVTSTYNFGTQFTVNATINANFEWAGQSAVLRAGENIAQGNLVYVDSSGDIQRTDADSNVTIPCIAIALEAINNGQPGLVLMQGWIYNAAWALDEGDYVFVSTAVGELTSTVPAGAGDQVQVVGIGLTEDLMYFNPDYTVLEIA